MAERVRGKRARTTPRPGGQGPSQTAASGKKGGGGSQPTEFSKRTLVEHQKQLREQRLLLSKLRAENATLRETLQAESANSQASTGLASSQLTLVSKLSEEAELYVAKIEQERRKASELEKRCKEFDKRILEGRSASDSLHKFLKDAGNITRTLENRLHSSKTKFGEFITQNKRHRRQIDELRFERAHFNSAYSKVEGDLQHVTSEIERVVADSKSLFDERLQVLQKVGEMKIISDEEQKNYMAQCRELNAVLQAFEQSEKNMHAGKLMQDLEEQLGSMSTEQEEELQRKIVRGKWQLAKEKALGDVLRDQAVTFEDALTRIQEATGYAHMDDFVSHFIQIEEHNFHRFKYLNSLNQDIERATDELRKYKMEMVVLGEQVSDKDSNWEELKIEAEDRVATLEMQAHESEEKGDELHKQVKNMCEILQRLSQKLGCKLDPDDLMPHESTEVSEANLLKWLAAVESRSAELLALDAAQHARIATDELDRPHVSLGPRKSGKTAILSIDSSPKGLLSATRAIIRPPSIDDEVAAREETDDTELDLPLDEDKIRTRIENNSESLVSAHLTWIEPRAGRLTSAHRNTDKDKKPGGGSAVYPGSGGAR